jgi:DNA-directed RNA polymerase subunit M/transcription elongation factor TFIIS
MEEIFDIYPELLDMIKINSNHNDILEKLAIYKITKFLEINYIDIDNLVMLISNNELTFEKLSNIEDKDLYEDIYYKNNNELEVFFKKEQEGNTLKATTDMYICRKCREKKCTYYELQIRSSDEPMTKFIKCCNCGYEWRQS